ncbi:MAG: hypothetical protein ACJ72W_10250 [Actinoallomurus sp.]
MVDVGEARFGGDAFGPELDHAPFDLDAPGRAPRAAAGGGVTRWYAALRAAATGPAAEAEAAYRDAAAHLDGCGMPGLERGLLPLALLCLRVRHGLSARPDEHTDWGPYEPWTRPLFLLARDRRAAVAAALREVPDPPRDLLFEALWCLTARAALAVGDREAMARAYAALFPAAAELAGAGSGPPSARSPNTWRTWPPRSAHTDQPFGNSQVRQAAGSAAAAVLWSAVTGAPQRGAGPAASERGRACRPGACG